MGACTGARLSGDLSRLPSGPGATPDQSIIQTNQQWQNVTKIPSGKPRRLPPATKDVADKPTGAVKPGPHPSRGDTASPTTGRDGTQGPPVTPLFKEQRSQDGCVSTQQRRVLGMGTCVCRVAACSTVTIGPQLAQAASSRLSRVRMGPGPTVRPKGELSRSQGISPVGEKGTGR